MPQVPHRKFRQMTVRQMVARALEGRRMDAGGAVRRVRGIAALLAAGLPALAGAVPALAQGSDAYSFASPPSAQANRVYGVNRQTGEVSACQFERPEGNSVGVTRCFAAGEGAGPQRAGTYTLIATGYRGETGIFRVNGLTGEMSICYVRELPGAGGAVESKILCTPPAK